MGGGWRFKRCETIIPKMIKASDVTKSNLVHQWIWHKIWTMPDVQFLLHQIYPILLLPGSSLHWSASHDQHPLIGFDPPNQGQRRTFRGQFCFNLNYRLSGHYIFLEEKMGSLEMTSLSLPLFPSFSHFFLSEVLCRSQAKEWRGSQIRRIRRKLDIIDKTTDLLFPHHLGRTTEISNVKAQKKEKIMRNFMIINKTNFLGNKYALKNVLISIQYISEFKIWSIWSDQFRSTAHND